MTIDFSVFVEYGPRLLMGFWLTIKIVIAAIILGMPWGVVVTA